MTPSPNGSRYTRQERLAELHDQLTEKVEQLTTSEGFKAMLDMSAKLHRYSMRNTLLILAQRPDATQVAGYRAWQKMGRQVRAGKDKAIWVLGPVTYKVRDLATDPADDNAEPMSVKELRGFKPVPVFDISDTDGPELPKPPHLTGEAPAAMWDGLTALLQERGYRVERAELPGGKQGSTSPTERRVRIDSRLQPMEALAVLFHEHAHVALGHMSEIEEYKIHRGPFEVEAESTVYVEMTAPGFDTKDWSVEYVSGWLEGASTKAMADIAERVVNTAHQTLDLLAPDNGIDLSNGIER